MVPSRPGGASEEVAGETGCAAASVNRPGSSYANRANASAGSTSVRRAASPWTTIAAGDSDMPRPVHFITASFAVHSW